MSIKGNDSFVVSLAHHQFLASRGRLGDFFTQVGNSLQEVLVGIPALVGSMVDSLETVQVQLTEEAFIFALVEVVWHHLASKPCRIHHLESGASMQPTHNVIEPFLQC